MQSQSCAEGSKGNRVAHDMCWIAKGTEVQGVRVVALLELGPECPELGSGWGRIGVHVMGCERWLEIFWLKWLNQAYTMNIRL